MIILKLVMDLLHNDIFFMMIKYLYDKYKASFYMLSYVNSSYNTKMSQYMIDNDIMERIETMDYIISGLYGRFEYCTNIVGDLNFSRTAATYGHLEILIKFVNGGHPLRTELINPAIENNNMEIFE
jgi:hypothetical protein